MSTTTTYTGIRTADLPNLGAVSDTTLFVGDYAGTGTFSASAMKTYFGVPVLDYTIPYGHIKYATKQSSTGTSTADLMLTHQNPGNHTTTDDSTMSILSTPVGSGVNGPINADTGLTISCIKQDWTTSAILGEVDGLTIYTRQGQSDTAGILVNSGCIAGFSAVLQGQSYQFAATTGAVVRGCDITLGAIETGATGAADQNMGSFVATSGTIQNGLSIIEQGTATVGNVIKFLRNDGQTTFTLDRNGAISSFSSFSGSAVSATGFVTGSGFKVGPNQVVGARDTGWTIGTGATPNKGAINYGTATVAQLAQRVMAMEQMFFAHGLTGT